MKERIVFMGTPEFAVRSLEVLINGGIDVAAVVTVPDKPAGRGQQLSESAVKKFAREKNLLVLQPEKLKDESFVHELQKLNADLFVVVAFRMLPEIIWQMPRLGTINLHASLLPQYRGAAPINWAVINGEKETGATTFFIEKEIDTGKIIDAVKIPVHEKDNAGIVHDNLMEAGAQLLLNTVRAIFAGTTHPVSQNEIEQKDLKPAPKIFKEDGLIQWTNSTCSIYNKIRGLSPYPGAWTKIAKEGQSKTLKIYSAEINTDGKDHTGNIAVNDGKIAFGCSDGWVLADDLQLEGKKRMKSTEFLNGFQPEGWTSVL